MRVTVIGSGLMGVTSAWFLARDGHDVTVVDRNGSPAQGTSFANAGMLTPSMADPWNAPGVLRHLLGWLGREDAPLLLRLRALPSLFGWGLSFLAHAQPARFRDNMRRNLRLANYSMSMLRELRANLSLAYDQRSAGTLKLFRTQRALEAAVQRFGELASLGLRQHVLGPAQVVALEPALAEVGSALAGGIHFPDDESGDARMFTQALAQHAEAAGAKFRFGMEVVGLERAGATVTAVVTTGEKLAADAVLMAAGSWSPLLMRRLGFSLPVRPVKGYSVTLHAGDWQHRLGLPVIDDALHAAVTPLGERLRVAGTAEFAGYDITPTPARVENLYKLLLAIFPSFAPHLDRAQAAPWAGLRPVAADGVPFIGRIGYENLFVNTGHGHLGWTLAAGSSRLAADLLQGRKPALDPAPYRPLRL